MAVKVNVDGQALEALDLRTAIESEGTSPPSLLPATAVEAVFRERSDEYVRVLQAELRSGISIDEPEILPASKASRGRRPLSILAPAHRVLYRALMDLLAPHLPPLERGGDAYEHFKLAPLDDAWSAYVVMADVAACYQYIDHGILLDELLSIAGEPSATQTVIDLLGALSGQRFGLPQNRTASDLLAEVVLDIPERALLRAGYSTWRYNDDFRIACTTRSASHIALEELERQLRRLGLTLNDEKTSIRDKAGYRQWTQAIATRLEEVQLEVEIDLTDFTSYEIEVTPELAEVEVETAIRLLDVWREDVRAKERQFGPEAVVGRTLVRASLVALSQHEGLQGVAYVAEIMEHEPSLMPQVSRYLAAVVRSNKELVDSTLHDILGAEESYVSSWQSLWLFEALNESSSLTEMQISWLQDHMDGRSDYVASCAAYALALHDEARGDAIARMYNSAKEASKPVLAAALAAAVGDIDDPLLRSVTDERPLLRWIAESVLQSQ